LIRREADVLFEISDNEAAALARALDGYLPELAEEAARTDRQPDAHELWDMYRALQSVRTHLSVALHQAAAASDLP
jgi:hypothetical protein